MRRSRHYPTPIASGSAPTSTMFNARDFDAIRAMITDDVRLDLVSKTRLNGKAEVSRYFGNYSKVSDWHLVPGLVEGHPAILVFDPNQPGFSEVGTEAEIFHAAELVGRQGRDYPGFPPRALHHRRRRISVRPGEAIRSTPR